MKILALIALSALAACAPTVINELTLPTPSTIFGQVSDVEDDGFTLSDATGSIEVEWESEATPLALNEGENVMVAGVIDEDESVDRAEIVAEEFDAYCLKRADGTVLRVIPAACPWK